MKFWPKIKGQPLWKNLRWRLINFDILIFCQNEFYFTLKHQNIIFRSHLTIYKVLRNLKFWPQIIRLPLWKKSKMAAAEISHLHIWKESLWFHSKTSPKHHFQVQFDYIQSLKKFEILTQNRRLFPLEWKMAVG